MAMMLNAQGRQTKRWLTAESFLTDQEPERLDGKMLQALFGIEKPNANKQEQNR